MKKLITLAFAALCFTAYPQQKLNNGGFESLTGNPSCSPLQTTKGLNYATSWRGLSQAYGGVYKTDFASNADIYYTGKTSSCVDPYQNPYAYKGYGMAKIEFVGGSNYYAEYAMSLTNAPISTSKTYKIEAHVRYTTYDAGGVAPLANGGYQNNPFQVGIAMVPASQSSSAAAIISYAIGDHNKGATIENEPWLDGYTWKKFTMYFTPGTNENYNIVIGAFGTSEYIADNKKRGLYIDDVYITELSCTNPIAQINGGATTAYICNGVMPVLSATSGAGNTYQWYKTSTNQPIAGATAATYTATSAEGYYVKVSTTGGCTSTSANIYVYNKTITLPPTVNYSINQGNSVQIGFTPLAGSYSYSWSPSGYYLSNSSISNPYSNPITTTNYTLTVTENTSGCKATWPTKVNVNFTIPCCPNTRFGMTSTNESDNLSAISYYPNPVNNELFVDVYDHESKQNAEVSIFTLDGKIVLSQGISNNAKNTIDISGLSNGLYFIQIKTENYLTKEKLIKQ